MPQDKSEMNVTDLEKDLKRLRHILEINSSDLKEQFLSIEMKMKDFVNIIQSKNSNLAKEFKNIETQFLIKLNELESENKKLRKDSNFSKEDFEGSNKELKTELKTLATKYKKNKEKYKQVMERNEELEEKLIALKNIKNSKKNEENKDNVESKYDIILGIDSLISANTKGWEIEFNDKFNCEEAFAKEYIAVGIIGRKNVGKTHIINKIGEENFPCDYYTSTKGLSIKYYTEKNRQIQVLLDTAGMNDAIFFYSKEDYFKMTNEEVKKVEKSELDRIHEIMINDRCSTDYFIQNFVVSSCNIIIIVVELLNENDQKIIERIRHLYPPKKTIIIIHNMFKLELKQQVLERAELEIEGAFFVKKWIIPDSKQEVPYYIEESQSEKKKNIIHFILGKDDCESGNFFNEATMNWLIKIISTQHDYSKFDLLTNLNRYWEENNRIYFATFLEEKEIPPFELIYENENANSKSDKRKTFYKLKSNKELELNDLEFNVFGAMKELDIRYHQFVINSPQREKIYYFELPGCMETPKMTLKRICPPRKSR